MATDATAHIKPPLTWRAPVIVMLLGIAAIAGLILHGPDAGIMGGAFVELLGAVIFITQTLVAKGKTKLVCLGVFCLFALTSWQMLRHIETIRAEPRWLVSSRHWKEAVGEQPAMDASGMKCLTWDTWGWVDIRTEAYLVFSPDDALRNYSPTHLSGLPQEVSQVQRLEKQWYSVTFYANEGWKGCGGSWRS